jgi:colanic acid biosynthesis glycosyl transferase WcaI
MARGRNLREGPKRLLLLSLVFPPDAVSTAQLFGEMVEDLVSFGWDVTVLTTKPHYNPPPHKDLIQLLTPVWGGLFARSKFRGATVVHAAIPKKGNSIWRRVFGWIEFHILSIIAAIVHVGRVDVILAPSPPLSIGVAAWAIGVLKSAPFVYNVQELYPDTAVRLGALKAGTFLGFLKRMETFVYKRAYAVTTIAPGMAKTIASRTVGQNKVRLIPNFVDTRMIVPRPRHNPFSEEFGLDDCFSVVYAGNMGPAQGLDVLIAAADLTRQNERIVYVFVGDGTSRSLLQEGARSRKLSNVRFIPQQPYERVPDIYGASDLCIVPLTSEFVVEAVPSKVYRIMGAERCVLAVARSNSDLAQVVMESDAGYVVEPNNPRALADAIQRVEKEPLGAAAHRGRAYVIAHVDRAVVVRKYSRLLNEASNSGAGGGRRRSTTEKL